MIVGFFIQNILSGSHFFLSGSLCHSFITDVRTAHASLPMHVFYNLLNNVS